MRLHIMAMLGLTLGCSSAANPPNLSLSASPARRSCSAAVPVTIHATGVLSDGAIVKGSVAFSTEVGTVDPPTASLDEYGDATTQLTCDILTEPRCFEAVTVTGTWSGVSASVSLPIAPPICDVASAADGCRCVRVADGLTGLRWAMPCVSEQSAVGCWNEDAPTQSSVVGGLPGVVYAVTLRFRGVLEQKSYSGGTNDGKYWQVGGTPATDGANLYKLTVSNPAQTFYLNRGDSNASHAWAVDYTATVQAATGASVTLIAQTLDGAEKKNFDANRMPIRIPDIPPYPAAYDGQFLQMDVVSVR